MRRLVDPWLVRRVVLLVCGVLLALALYLFLSVQVAEVPVPGGHIETINGQDNTGALALPLVLFVVGAAGFLAALGWRPGQHSR